MMVGSDPLDRPQEDPVTANPLSLLADVIPAKARKYVYAIVATALFVYGLWEVAAGDVKSFLIALGTAAVTALAAANTPAAPAEVAEKAVELIEEHDPVLAAEVAGDEGVADEGVHYDGHAGA